MAAGFLPPYSNREENEKHPLFLRLKGGNRGCASLQLLSFQMLDDRHQVQISQTAL